MHYARGKEENLPRPRLNFHRPLYTTPVIYTHPKTKEHTPADPEFAKTKMHSRLFRL
jgi:hypothetical protein